MSVKYKGFSFFCIFSYLTVGCADFLSHRFTKSLVATPGIEPGLGASETHVLSIVLRG